jgi:hypothetical protein
VFISHKLGEVTASPTASRSCAAGASADRAIGTASRAELAALMVGREMPREKPAHAHSRCAPPGARRRDGAWPARAAGAGCRLAYRPRGRDRGYRGRVGQRPRRARRSSRRTGPRPRGAATFAGARSARRPRRDAGRHRAHPEDRHHEGVSASSARENLAIESSTRQHPPLRLPAPRHDPGPGPGPRSRLTTCAAPPTRPSACSSGGNMQRVILPACSTLTPAHPRQPADPGSTSAPPPPSSPPPRRPRARGRIVLISEDSTSSWPFRRVASWSAAAHLPEPVEELTWNASPPHGRSGESARRDPLRAAGDGVAALIVGARLAAIAATFALAAIPLPPRARRWAARSGSCSRARAGPLRAYRDADAATPLILTGLALPRSPSGTPVQYWGRGPALCRAPCDGRDRLRRRSGGGHPRPAGAARRGCGRRGPHAHSDPPQVRLGVDGS